MLTLSPQTGTAFKLLAGQNLKIIDPLGEQVSDLFCTDAKNLKDALSAGRTIDYNDTIYLQTGHFLYSQGGQRLLEIIDDTCGRHDLLVTPCSLQMFHMIHNNKEDHPSCLSNLETHLSQFSVPVTAITSTFNVFMNIAVAQDGKIKIGPPLSKAGDFIIFKACCDLVVGLTACSDEGTNNGRCKPIRYEIF